MKRGSPDYRLRNQLIEEMLIVALVCIIFLWHARSALVAAVTLPLGILISFLAIGATVPSRTLIRVRLEIPLFEI